jgi:ribonuclease HI
MVLNIFTDGSCVPNPGEMKIGIVAMHGNKPIHQISKRMGAGTSNRAELLAVYEALHWAPKDSEIVLHVDSKYAIGVVSKNWNATKNLELITAVRRLFASFPKIKMVKVKGHSGIVGNEMADSLAG